MTKRKRNMGKYRLPIVPAKLPIGVKIYGLASCMLALLGSVAAVNAHHMKQVDRKLSVLAEYALVIQQQVTAVNTDARRQEIYFEKTLRRYAMPSAEPETSETYASAQVALTELGQAVDQHIDQAIALTEEAVIQSYSPEDIAQFSRLGLILTILEEDHQDFQDQALEVLRLWDINNLDDAALVEADLENREQRFNQRIYHLLEILQQYNENATRQIDHYEQALLRWNLRLAGLTTVLGLTLAASITTYLVRPLKQLVTAAKAFDSGDLTTQVTVHSRDEVEILASAFNTMTEGIQQKEYLQKTFGQYLDPRIVESLINHQNDGASEQQSNHAVMTVFFSDLAKFSTLSETLTPTVLVEVLNQYFTLATAPITEFQGVIDKFIGDAIVAFWGPPFVSPEKQAKLACYAALAQTAQLRKLQQRLPELMGIRKGLPQLGVRVGLDTGELVVGNVGTAQAKSFTTLGTAVRVAEQLEGLNKRYGTTILITARTRELAGQTVATREIDMLSMGKAQTPIPIYELLDYSSTLSPEMATLCDAFGDGLSAYRQQSWTVARAKFQICLDIKADDGPSQYYLEKIQKLVVEQPTAQLMV